MRNLTYTKGREYLLFPIGEIFISIRAERLLYEIGKDPIKFVERHGSGDFGDLNRGDTEDNMRNIEYGGCIFSNYWLERRQQLWIITEPSRARTIIMLPMDGG